MFQSATSRKLPKEKPFLPVQKLAPSLNLISVAATHEAMHERLCTMCFDSRLPKDYPGAVVEYLCVEELIVEFLHLSFAVRIK